MGVVLTTALALSANSGSWAANKAHHSIRAKHGRIVQSAVVTTLRAPRFTLPANSTLIAEANFSENNILSSVKQAVPAFLHGMSKNPDGLGGMIKMLDLSKYGEIVKQLKAVRISQFNVSRTMDVDKSFAFFERQVPTSQGWERIIYQSFGSGNGLLAVYARNGEYLGIMLDPKKNQNIAFGSIGFIDVAKLCEWFGTIGATISFGQPAQPANQPAQPANQPAATPANTPAVENVPSEGSSAPATTPASPAESPAVQAPAK